MTDRSREFLRCNGYVIVGLLAGFGIGIGMARDFKTLRQVMDGRAKPSFTLSST